MKTMLKAAMLTAGLFVASAGALVAQDAPAVPDFAAPAAPAAPAAQSTELAANPDQSQPAATAKKSSTGFWAVVTGSGGLGIILWLCLFGAGVASIYFVFDCSILFKADKMIPKSLVDKVSAAMAEGALPTKVKELIALTLSVGAQCDGCIAAHARGAARAGATKEEAAEAIGVTFLMQGGPATVYGPRAFDAFCEYYDAQHGQGT